MFPVPYTFFYLKMVLFGLSRRVLLGRLAVLLPLRLRAAGASTVTSHCDATASADGVGSRLDLPPLRDGWRRLYLCRHGETDWNVQNRVQGSTDISLNQHGEYQAQRLAQLLADEPIELVVSSVLSRASATADAIAALRPSAGRIRDARVNEMCFGSIEGLSLVPGNELRGTYDALLSQWADGETSVPFPGDRGESPEMVADRAMAALLDMGLLPPPGGDAGDGQAAVSPRHVCLVAHGRFNKILLSKLRGDVSRCSEIQQGNTCVNVIDIAAADGAVDVLVTDFRGHLQSGSTA